MVEKQKLTTLCQQRDKVDDLKLQLNKCDMAINKLIHKASEIREQFDIQIEIEKIEKDLKILLNQNMKINYPGFEQGLFHIEYDADYYQELNKKNTRNSEILEDSKQYQGF